MRSATIHSSAGSALDESRSSVYWSECLPLMATLFQTWLKRPMVLQFAQSRGMIFFLRSELFIHLLFHVLQGACISYKFIIIHVAPSLSLLNVC